jgi:hypothetical protein
MRFQKTIVMLLMVYLVVSLAATTVNAGSTGARVAVKGPPPATPAQIAAVFSAIPNQAVSTSSATPNPIVPIATPNPALQVGIART